ncbi:MAG TPA: hypothetical protein VN920_16740 [Pyrinomonadaceae bacterium]|nr:hypothetical protein [Pyrinomonadaceae bacterium]
MTEEEYLRMKTILNAIIEQQAAFAEQQTVLAENQKKADERQRRNEEGIAAFLTIAEIHEQEIAKMNKRTDERFAEVAERFQEIGKKSAETDARINALVNVVERYISKN